MGLKAIFFTLMPLRFVSSIAIAASLFWVFVGCFVGNLWRGLVAEERFYGLAFAAHILLVLCVSAVLYSAIPVLYVAGLKFFFASSLSSFFLLVCGLPLMLCL